MVFIIDIISQIFTTREIAIIIWINILLLYSIAHKNVRSSIKSILKLIIKLILTIPGMVIFAYSMIFGILLYKIGYLEFFIIKDYILWVMFCEIPIIYRLVNKYNTIMGADIIKDVFKLSIIPLFIINSYTMSLIAELIIVPILFLSGACMAMFDYRQEYEGVKKVFDFVITIISIYMVCFAIKGFFTNLDDLIDVMFWKSIGMDIICILGFIPMFMYIRLYMLYEKVRIHIKIRSKLSKFVINLVVFKNCTFSRRRLVNILDNINGFYKIEDWIDLDNRIKDISKEEYKASYGQFK